MNHSANISVHLDFIWKRRQNITFYTHTYTHIYIYICVCVCLSPFSYLDNTLCSSNMLPYITLDFILWQIVHEFIIYYRKRNIFENNLLVIFVAFLEWVIVKNLYKWKPFERVDLAVNDLVYRRHILKYCCTPIMSSLAITLFIALQMLIGIDLLELLSFISLWLT